MIKLRWLFAFLVFFIYQSVVAQSPAGIALQNILLSYQTFQANYNQTTYDSTNRLVQSASGRMMFMRPGRFRWETNLPVHQWIIGSGQNMWIYDVDLAQVTYKSLKNHHAADPAMLLAGNVPELLKHFFVTEKDGWFLLRPYYAQTRAFKYVQLLFVNNQLTTIRVLDSMNQTSEFDFSQIAINQPLDPSLFQFTPPPGVQVIQQP